MNNVSYQDWENIPLSEAALEALTSFFVALLDSDDENELERAKQQFKKIRKQDMQRWLQETGDQENGWN